MSEHTGLTTVGVESMASTGTSVWQPGTFIAITEVEITDDFEGDVSRAVLTEL
jgi:hypothetical protein